MKKFRKFASILMLAAAVVFAAGCTKPDEPNNGENGEVSITVYTFDPRNITETTAECGCGVILSPNNIRINELGLCWSTRENPTVSGPHHSIKDGTTTTSFMLEELEPNTMYHVRAYVLYNSEYYYGVDKTFTTLEHGGGDNPPTPETPTGTISGKFTINSSGKQVYFSKGNLQAKHGVLLTSNGTMWVAQIAMVSIMAMYQDAQTAMYPRPTAAGLTTLASARAVGTTVISTIILMMWGQNQRLGKVKSIMALVLWPI